MSQTLQRKWFQWFGIPIILVIITLAIIIYVVNFPGGGIAAGMLNYNNIIRFYREHILMVVTALGLSIAVGIPVGLMLTRPSLRLLGKVVEGVVNVGQTIPSLAILAIMFVYLGFGFQTAVFALWLYSILPILRNTYAGITSIEPEVLEAAKGMGMSSVSVLTRIELPLALPVIMGGIRTSVVICIGTATLATFIGAGGLGDPIALGISMRRDILVFTGASLSATLAIFMDHILGQVEEALLSSD
ncbi:MAG: ABC transporter permease [Candidatus Syntrophonatronum acetioxidans]|uniref:ABC transporter permease n=1 Tax=Candidatus Syntrophonatronum acetioxidans TaxID=1795816 RepID=A0A424YER6_9FIRM|nr:MAG: ABC transporter permease [Candidatus Syntrophonatronum acetioxidans]